LRCTDTTRARNRIYYKSRTQYRASYPRYPPGMAPKTSPRQRSGPKQVAAAQPAREQVSAPAEASGGQGAAAADVSVAEQPWPAARDAGAEAWTACDAAEYSRAGACFTAWPADQEYRDPPSRDS